MEKIKQVKIITTCGPAFYDEKSALKVLKAGSDIVRFNFSHGSHPEHLEKMNLIRETAKNAGKKWEILLDTKGPEIRTGRFEDGQAVIEKGDNVFIHTQRKMGTRKQFGVSYPGFVKEVKVGSKILIDDGNITFEVIDKNEKHLVCKALNSHVLTDKKSVSTPGTRLNKDFLSAQDVEDIKFGVEQGVDYIALSFVQSKEDMHEAIDLLKKLKAPKIKLIAKLESELAIKNFEEILPLTDGIMVARGDLGVEIDQWKVPVYQKQWVKAARAKNKIAIVATQMMESMIVNPRPTRAEISDIFNAVLDGATHTMLSAESAKGKYGAEAVSIMARTAKEALKYKSSI